MIDLHMHTTASDGRSTPEGLVAEAAARGIRVMAVTDHDTTAAIAACQAAARQAGMICHAGIEITAVEAGRDVHMLGYGFNPQDTDLLAFLARQRTDRRRRFVAIGERLAQIGVPVDLAPMLREADQVEGRAIGRPAAAAALVAAGHVRDTREAFDRFLGEGQPAFIERIGPSPIEVVGIIARAGGVASLAHPGKYPRDSLIPGLADAGMPAIEVYHPDHEPVDVARYRTMARSLGLLMTGGSDYHGAGSPREPAFGRVHLPSADFARLAERAGWTVLHAD